MLPHEAVWQPLIEVLDRTAAANREIEVWLRDDDAVAPTQALDRLARVCEANDLPVLLAVIPAPAGPELAAFVKDHPLLHPAQHGYSHANHATADQRACELGGARSPEAVWADLAAGRRKILDLFGPDAAQILVPPWNRIDATFLPALPARGYAMLSTFGPVAEPVPGLRRLNCHVDIIDWRSGRVGRPHDKLVAKLAGLIAGPDAAIGPIGILTHHLVHDDTAWRFLDLCIPLLRRHPAVRFIDATRIIGREGASDLDGP